MISHSLSYDINDFFMQTTHLKVRDLSVTPRPCVSGFQSALLSVHNQIQSIVIKTFIIETTVNDFPLHIIRNEDNSLISGKLIWYCQ